MRPKRLCLSTDDKHNRFLILIKWSANLADRFNILIE